ncbi:succinate dehydrogenase, cytochrome b556 subunit [Rhodococcus sp. ACS1]|uniref:Succinate dehydrogenase subunit C n=1 Tax=Rhodococcus koreensis TaxID=99653 RepID=A0A1H4X091_9NOCA|nr:MULTISPECIES: succinate dehydrogenase, cytochrome b556 subunit [Rhodococcus]PBC47864.1 succinate dehydrogenase, cytochrome b556 subunit [Rhodococcus sp. ACS1]SEC99076.1 succinate dehydrogenase subunit C [Rhodococcus koreensis]
MDDSVPCEVLRVDRSPTRTGLARSTFYRGGLSMWAWVAQRVSGMVIYVFLLVHVADNLMLRVSPAAYDEVIGTYKTLVMGIGEIGLVAAILGHGFNGIRIVLLDFWAKGIDKSRWMLWTVIVLWVLVMVPFVIRHLSHYL